MTRPFEAPSALDEPRRMVAAPTERRPVIIGLATVALGALCAIAVMAYAPGLDGVFVFDSIERVIRNDALQITSLDAEQLLGAAYAGQVGYPQRGLAYLTLAFNYYFAGQQFDPFVFKLTNLIVHILNGLLVFIFATLVLSRWRQRDLPNGREMASLPLAALAVMVMGLWLLHPIQLTSVLYVVQRMTSLAATWVLVGAILFMVARGRLEQRRRFALSLMYGSVTVCTGLGFLCKQSALLLPAFIAVLEVFMFERRPLPGPEKRALLTYFLITLALPMALGLILLLAHPELILAGYESRDFDLWQRLMTQGRVLFLYLGLLMIPGADRFGLYHDDLVTSAGLFEPLTTIAALATWALIFLAIVWGARRRAPWAFGAAWFLIGHSMESTILPLEQVHEHRNYAPSVGIWLAVAYYAGAVWERAERLRVPLMAAAGGWLLSLALVTHIRAQSWQDPATLMESLARHHPESYRSNIGYAFNSIPVSADLSIRFDAFRRAAALDNRTVIPLIEMSKIAIALNQFIEGEINPLEIANENNHAPAIAEMQLLADANYNQALIKALHEEINRRLSSKPVRTDSVIALIGLVDCALNGNHECIVLREPARIWHNSALSNTQLPRNYAAALELSMAKIYASTGDYDTAVDHAHRAGLLSPDNLAYRLQEATLYALLERWDELAGALNEVQRRFPVRSQSNASFRDLQLRLDASK